jgi:hypothetical protein
MTADEWMVAHDPLEMLAALGEVEPAKYERLWTYVAQNLRGFGEHATAELIERSVSGTADHEAVNQHVQSLEGRVRLSGGSYLSHRPVRLSADAQRARAGLAAFGGTTVETAVRVTEATRHALQRDQCAWLRCLFVNPFRRVMIDPSWLTSTVATLAEGIYAERAFDRLPILADALMDAGCDNADVLNHCRDIGPHVRGCWVVDLLTGRA